MSCTPYTERDSSSGPNALQVRDLRSPLKLISLREGDGVDVLSLPGHRKKSKPCTNCSARGFTIGLLKIFGLGLNLWELESRRISTIEI